MMASGYVEPFLRTAEDVREIVDAIHQARDITNFDPNDWRIGTIFESPIPGLQVEAVAEALLAGGFEPVTRDTFPVSPFAPGDLYDRGHGGHERGTGAPLWGSAPGSALSEFDAAGNLNLSAADMSRLMFDWGGGAQSSPGGGGGAAAARQAAQRALQVQQMLEDLEMKKTGVLRDYAPYLNKAEANIARHQAGQGHDVGIYSSLMRLVPNVYARTGQATDENYAKARQALATQDATARGQIDASFASARGRVRALVLSTSQYSPEAAETIGQGIDEISAYIGRGMASDQAGWDRVLQASHRLAEATLQAASTAAVGEAARTGRQTLRQYQNAIDDLLLEKRRLVESRDNAIRQLQDEADLALKQLQDQWALADAASGGGGGRSAQQAIQRFLGNMEGYTLDAARQKGISYYLDGDAGAGLTTAQKNMIAEIAMEAGELGFTNLSAYLNWAETNGPTMGGDRADQLATYLNFVDQNPTLDGVLDEAVAQSAGTDAWYEQQVRDPDSLWAIMAATQEYASGFPNVDPQEMMEWVLDQQNPRTALLGLQQGPDYGTRLLAATNPTVLAGALGVGTAGFSSPLGPSRTAATSTWAGGPGNF